MDRFFVFGLPRSRTAWLANMLTYESAVCLHEALIECPSLDAFETKLSLTGGIISGASDTLAVWLGEQICDFWSDARIVVLTRKPGDFVEQMARFGAPKDHSELLLARFKEFEDYARHNLGNRAMFVPTKDLNDFDTVQAIWRHIGMATVMNRVRFDMLKDLKVEGFPERFIVKAKANAHNFQALTSGDFVVKGD